MLRTLDLPARTKSLKYSFGIVASASALKRAAHLAETVKAIRPGVYAVGACTCDLWRYSCSCKDARLPHKRDQQTRPCAHYLALYLTLNWVPSDPDPVLYLRTAGIEQPVVLAMYAQVKTYRGLHRIISACEDYAWLEPVDKQATCTGAPIRLLNSLVMFYE